MNSYAMMEAALEEQLLVRAERGLLEGARKARWSTSPRAPESGVSIRGRSSP